MQFHNPSEKRSQQLKNNIMQFQMKVDSSESPINGFLRFSKKNSNLTSSGCNGNVLENAESFYHKLSHLHESSGLNLVIDFRKTLLDLHVLYKEVVKRGGFNQVNKERGWQEVAFALKLESIDPKYGYQLQKAYALFLYQFEQMFFYRSPDKPTKATDFAGHSSYFENSSTMKQDIVEASDQKLAENNSAMKPDILEASGQKLAENSSAMKPDILEASGQKLTENSSAMKHDILEAPDQKFTDAEEVSSENEDKCDPMSTVGGPSEPKVPSPKTSIRKEKKKRPGAIMGRRTGYNIFIKQECDRLRKIRGLNYDGRTFREMAVDAWRRLSESDREQYLEESKKHKKNIMEKKTAYIEHRGMQDTDGENNVAD